MDLMTGFPDSERGHNTIIVWVDRLTKFVTAVSCKEATNSQLYAQLTVDHLITKEGWPKSFVSDRDGRFVAAFGQSVLELMGVKSLMSSSFHPQTDGQTERSNRTIEETLRHFASYHQRDWDTYLQTAVFAINNSYQQSVQNSPFFLNKGRHPRLPSDLSAITDKIPAPPAQSVRSPQAQEWHEAIRTALHTAKKFLQQAQDRQKTYADQHRRELILQVGDWVLLSTKNLRLKADQVNKAKQKLLPRFVGPYQVLSAIGKVAYKLSLPAGVRIHPVFHVSLLKPYKDPSVVGGGRPERSPLDWLEPDPKFEVECILKHEEDAPGTIRHLRYLIRWKQYSADWDSWEPEENVWLDIPDLLTDYHTAQNLPLPASARPPAPKPRPGRRRGNKEVVAKEPTRRSRRARGLAVAPAIPIAAITNLHTAPPLPRVNLPMTPEDVFVITHILGCRDAAI
jgi:hypothetical protein